MTYDRKFGQPEGLADRLEEWIHRLGHDKMLPWVGLGLIDDLRAASEQLRGSTAIPPSHKPEIVKEYDL